MGVSRVLVAQIRPRRVTLLAGGVVFSSADEGVYTCGIRDENGVRQTLYIGVYTSNTYQSSGVLVYCKCISTGSRDLNISSPIMFAGCTRSVSHTART